MLRVVRTNCMGMPMSDTPVALRPVPTALTHAREVAHWLVLLLGWLWLGEQGMQWGWSWASGVLAVALWWAVRLLCRGSALALRCGPWAVGLLGLLTVCGVYGLQSTMTQPWAHGVLLGLAAVWGLWSALIETRSQVSTFELAPVAWHPVLAAALVACCWLWPDGEPFAETGFRVLLAVCAGVLYAHDRCSPSLAPACRGPRTGLQTLLAPSAMGLMMGTLWLGNAWCAGLGLGHWTDGRCPPGPDGGLAHLGGFGDAWCPAIACICHEPSQCQPVIAGFGRIDAAGQQPCSRRFGDALAFTGMGSALLPSAVIGGACTKSGTLDDAQFIVGSGAAFVGGGRGREPTARAMGHAVSLGPAGCVGGWATGVSMVAQTGFALAFFCDLKPCSPL